MSLNSNSVAAGGGGGADATVHSTGAFSSLGYTHVLEGAGAHPVRGVPCRSALRAKCTSACVHALHQPDAGVSVKPMHILLA